MEMENISVVNWHLIKGLGPGAYDLPPILGKNRINSKLTNTPAFSIAQSTGVTIAGNGSLIVNKDHSGFSTPGVGSYNPKHFHLRFPSYAQLKEKRFHFEDQKEIRLPIMYAKDYSRLSTRFAREFSRAPRFQKPKLNLPGPGEYNIYQHLTVEESLKLKAQFSVHSPGSLLTNKSYSARISPVNPGPGNYDTAHSTLSKKIAKFGSVKEKEKFY